MSEGHKYLIVDLVSCAGFWCVWWQGWTHQHLSDRVGHESHVGLQDVIVEGWGQHPLVLEPRLPLQQQQTFPWTTDGCVWASGRLGPSWEEPRVSGEISRARFSEASTLQGCEFPICLSIACDYDSSEIEVYKWGAGNWRTQRKVRLGTIEMTE